MKKCIYIMFTILIIVVAIFIGRYIFYKENNVNQNKLQQSMPNSIVEEKSYSVKNDITIQTAVKEDKISPNAELILKKEYEECGHVIKEYKKIPQELVNLTKEELKKEWPEWNVEEFSSHEVILSKNEKGTCNEHYILKEKDGLIAIYKINNKVEQLEEVTGISIDYLTQNDKEKIKEGIKVYGLEELNSVLEDYE